MKNKFLTMLLVAMVAIVVSACGQSEEKKTAKYEEPELSAKEMIDKMLDMVEQPALMELQPDQVKDFYTLNTDKIEELSIRIPMMNIKTNEIAIFKVKDEKDVAEVEDAVKARAEAVQKQFETYLPDQYENAKNYKVVTKGKYVLFVISDQADEIVKIYHSFFEK
ncbi:DUF4358 domain-containing protein [Lysinibacillus sp. 54212]|uniref:DUF4358 domain-containing protein n=1 Tax=Lysinibacillus sp. 54212 TaxID=3119829 RepID=UPI002FC7E263